MNGTESNGRDRPEPHPIVGVLREQGRSQSWLARRIDRSHEHTNRVLNKLHPATRAFRAACARELGMDEAALFHANGSSASRPAGTPNNGSIGRAGSAVGRAYLSSGGVSVSQTT